MTQTLYCSVDDWAINKGYTDFSTYDALDKPFPSEATLKKLLRKSSSTINKVVGANENVDLTGNGKDNYLEDVCYRATEMRIDDNQARSTQNNRGGFIPKDYIYARDRGRLVNLGVVWGYRKRGGVVT